MSDKSNKLIMEYHNYLKNHGLQLEDDEFSKQLVKEHFEVEDIKQRWSTILGRDQESEATVDIPNKFSVRKLFMPLGIAASLAIMLMVYFPNTQQVAELGPVEELLQEVYAYPVSRDIVKGSMSQGELRTLAYQHYQERKYPEAITAFNELIELESESTEDRFFLGLSYLYNRNPELAVKEFDQLLEVGDSEREDYIVWYLALALLDAGDNERATIYLTQVSKWNNNKGQLKLAGKAIELLESI